MVERATAAVPNHAVTGGLIGHRASALDAYEEREFAMDWATPSCVTAFAQVRGECLCYCYYRFRSHLANIVRALVQWSAIRVDLAQEPAVAQPFLVIGRHFRVLPFKRVPTNERQDMIEPYTGIDHQSWNAPIRAR